MTDEPARRPEWHERKLIIADHDPVIRTTNEVRAIRPVLLLY